MAHRPPEDSADARRRKFLQSFQNFDANSRFPAPYTHFAGKPLTEASGQGWRYDALGIATTRTRTRGRPPRRCGSSSSATAR